MCCSSSPTWSVSSGTSAVANRVSTRSGRRTAGTWVSNPAARAASVSTAPLVAGSAVSVDQSTAFVLMAPPSSADREHVGGVPGEPHRVLG